MKVEHNAKGVVGSVSVVLSCGYLGRYEPHLFKRPITLVNDRVHIQIVFLSLLLVKEYRAHILNHFIGSVTRNRVKLSVDRTDVVPALIPIIIGKVKLGHLKNIEKYAHFLYAIKVVKASEVKLARGCRQNGSPVCRSVGHLGDI